MTGSSKIAFNRIGEPAHALFAGHQGQGARLCPFGRDGEDMVGTYHLGL